MYNPQPQSRSRVQPSAPGWPGNATSAANTASANPMATAAGQDQLLVQIAGLASVFRTARQQLDRDPTLSSSATHDLVSRAHQSLPHLCNLVFGFGVQGQAPLALGSSSNSPVLELLLPNGPLFSVLVHLANDRTTYVYEMNASMLPEPSLAKLRSGQVGDLPDVYSGRVSSSSTSTSQGRGADGSGGMGLRCSMLEFFLFHFAHAPLRMAQAQQQQLQQQSSQLQQQQYPGGRRLSGVWESASSLFSHPTGTVNAAAAGVRKQSGALPTRQPFGPPPSLVSLDANPPTVYTFLLQSYLGFFIPTNPASESPTVFTTTSSSTSSYSWSPAPTSSLRSPTRTSSFSTLPGPGNGVSGASWWANDRLACSTFFIGCLIECWLGQEPYGPTRREPIKILGKDVLNALYLVVNHVSCETLLDVLQAGVPTQVLGLSRWAEMERDAIGLGRIALRAAYHQLSPPLYRFLHSALSLYPLTDSEHGCVAMQQVLQLWIRWITPMPAVPMPSPPSSTVETELVDAFVATNLACYTTLMHIYLTRALDLFPLAQPRANSRKPAAGYADDMLGVVQVLMVFATLTPTIGWTVYHASVAQLEQVMMGGALVSQTGGSLSASVASMRSTLESHMAWLEGLSTTSSMAAVRARWRPVLLGMAMGALPSDAFGASDGGLVRTLLTEAVLGWHTRQAILKPYNDSAPEAASRTDAVPTTTTTPAQPSSSSPRSASFAYRVLDLPVISAGVRAFASSSHVLRPLGVPDAVITREQQVMDQIIKVASQVARVSAEEVHEMHTRAAVEVHEFVMQGMAASGAANVGASASPTSLGRGITQHQLNTAAPPLSPTASGWGLPGPLADLARAFVSVFGSGSSAPPSSAVAATGTNKSLIGQHSPPNTCKVDAVDLSPDQFSLLDSGRLQLLTGARLCPPVPNVRGHALPRHIYTSREWPMVVDVAYALEDAVAGAMGQVYGWSVRGQRAADDERGVAGWPRAHKVGYMLTGFFSRRAHALVNSIGFRNLADRVLLVWILLARYMWVLVRLSGQYRMPSVFVYPLLMAFVAQYPFALEPTPSYQFPLYLTCMAVVMVGLFTSDYGGEPAHFLVVLCMAGGLGVGGWRVIDKWTSGSRRAEDALLVGSRENSPAHTGVNGPLQPRPQPPTTPGRASGPRPVSPLAGMKISQYGSVRS